MKLGLGNIFVKDNGRGKKLIAPTAPSLDLQFAATKSLTAVKGPTPILTRASTATYVDVYGNRQTAAINAPRFHHDESLNGSTATATSSIYSGTFYFSGVLDHDDVGIFFPYYSSSDQQALLFYSFLEQNWYIFYKEQIAVASNFQKQLKSLGLLIEAPSTNIVLNSNNTKSVGQTIITFTSTGSGVYALSCDAASNGATAIFNNYSEDTYTITPMIRFFTVFSVDEGSECTLTVDTGSVKNIQVENIDATGPTSYIPTGATPVTRSADVCTISGSNFSGFYNGPAGTLVSEFTSSASSNASYVTLSNGNIAANSIHFDNDPAAPSSRAVYYSGSSVVASLVLGAQSAAGTTEKFATAYASSDYAASRNGGTVVTDNSGIVPQSMIQMNIGSDERTEGIYYTNSCIASIKYYKSRLSNSMLKTLST